MGASRNATLSPIKYPDNVPDKLSGMEVTEAFEKRAHALLSQSRMACEQARTWGIGRRHKSSSNDSMCQYSLQSCQQSPI